MACPGQAEVIRTGHKVHAAAWPHGGVKPPVIYTYVYIYTYIHI